MITIDGSYGEGGGQILRTALALSCITNKAVHITNIRKGRHKPGLLQQHLTCVKAAKKITRAKVKGDEFRSQELLFEPAEIESGKYFFNVAEERGSAGSVTLVLQTILPILIRANESSSVSISGGTHTKWSPPVHYTQKVLQSTLKSLGLDVSVALKKWGFYPIGKGEIEVKIESTDQIKDINLAERGSLQCLSGISVVAGLPLSIAERQKREVKRNLKDWTPEIEVLEVSTASKGTFVFLLAEFENLVAGFSALGEPGKLAEKVADEACDDFLYYYNSGQAIEQWLADQIILFLALAKENSVFTTSKISQHLLTNIWVIKKFLDANIEIAGELDKPGKVQINI